MGERTAMNSGTANSGSVKPKPQKPKPSMHELNEKSERIKARLNSHASSIDADTKSLLMAIRNVGTAPLASVGWIMAMVLTALPARSSLPLWLKIAVSTAQEVLANPKTAQTQTQGSPASTARVSARVSARVFARVSAQPSKHRASTWEP